MWIEPNQAGESVSAEVRTLHNDREKTIYNWHSRDMQPVFHYPILTYSETWEFPLSCLSAFGFGKQLGLLPVGSATVDYVCDW